MTNQCGLFGRVFVSRIAHIKTLCASTLPLSFLPKTKDVLKCFFSVSTS